MQVPGRRTSRVGEGTRELRYSGDAKLRRSKAKSKQTRRREYLHYYVQKKKANQRCRNLTIFVYLVAFDTMRFPITNTGDVR